MSSQTFILIVLLVAVVILTAGWRWSLGRAGRASRARNARAQWGESEAEKLLADEGFVVVDWQVERSWSMWVDGEPVEVGVRADLIVERDGQMYVAEVKTGRLAPKPTFAATRRQLLEYDLVFADHGLLLVNVEQGAIHDIAFMVSRNLEARRTSHP